MSPFQEIIKRGFDIAFATAGLLLLSPLLLLISLGIKSESPGPIVCRHKRYGLNNAAFEVFEFRTTLARQEEKTFTHIPNEIWSATRFGRLLRRSGMDKIPQLVNVLRGEMSIVGPHPFATAPGIFSTFPNCIKSGLDFSVGRKSTTIRARLPIRLRATTAALNVIAIISKIARSRST